MQFFPIYESFLAVNKLYTFRRYNKNFYVNKTFLSQLDWPFFDRKKFQMFFFILEKNVISDFSMLYVVA